MPFLSRWLFAGIRHQGWQIQAEAVTLPPVTSDTGEAGAKDATVPSPNGCANGSANGTARPPPPTRVLTGEAIGYDKLFDDVLQGEVRGESFGVRPQPCPAFWLWKTLAAHVKDGKVVAVKAEVPEAGLGCGPAKRGERVILYLVGGGFNSGNPLTGPLSWTMTRQSGLRLLGVNFRKSTCDNQAFPASLQDALAGYAYLVRRLNFEPRNIILLGDSAGGNLCIALQLYLSALMHASTAPGATDFGLGRPGKLILHSPWADLTLSSPTYTEHWGYDILHPSICAFARDSYLRHFLVPRPQHLHTKLLPAAQRAEEEAAFRNITPATSEMPPTDEKVSSSKRNANGPCNGDARVTKLAPSLPVLPDTLAARFPATDAGRAAFASDLPHTISQLGAAHPFFSPGLPATQSKYLARAMELFGPLPGTVSEKTKKAEPETRFLIFAGGAELFAGEIRALVRNLTSVTGVRVEYVEGEH